MLLAVLDSKLGPSACKNVTGILYVLQRPLEDYTGMQVRRTMKKHLPVISIYVDMGMCLIELYCELSLIHI